MNIIRKKFLFSVCALLSYLFVANPALTGVAVHEWAAAVLLVLFVIHCAAHYDWLVDTIKGFMGNISLAQQGNFIVDIMLLVIFLVAMISGLGISGTLLPAFGFYVEGYYFWNPLHSISAKLLFVLFGVHIILHRKWISSGMKFTKEKRRGGGYEK